MWKLKTVSWLMLSVLAFDVALPLWGDDPFDYFDKRGYPFPSRRRKM
jgi:hypothetical protein